MERLEVWKKMGVKRKAWASNIGLVTMLAIKWKELDHDALIEFLNTFVIKGSEIYFSKRNIMYVISE